MEPPQAKSRGLRIFSKKSGFHYTLLANKTMHLRELFHQPVNLIISIIFVASFGLVTTSLMLKSAGLPDPMTSVGEKLGLMVLDHFFGATPVAASTE
jgi:hypothetical protein